MPKQPLYPHVPTGVRAQLRALQALVEEYLAPREKEMMLSYIRAINKTLDEVENHVKAILSRLE